ncbi:hypothetical protein FQZ97_1197080 [compost metagenome]
MVLQKSQLVQQHRLTKPGDLHQGRQRKSLVHSAQQKPRHPAQAIEQAMGKRKAVAVKRQQEGNRPVDSNHFHIPLWTRALTRHNRSLAKITLAAPVFPAQSR